MEVTELHKDTNISVGEKSKVPVSIKKKWSLKKKLYIIGGSIVAAFLVIFIVVNAATSAPVKVSNQLVAYIQASNGTAAYNLLSTGAKEVVDAQVFDETVKQIGPILNGKPDMKSKEVKGETGNAATAKVVYSIHGSDGFTYNFTVNLVKDSAEWKVLNFASEKQ